MRLNDNRYRNYLFSVQTIYYKLNYFVKFVLDFVRKPGKLSGAVDLLFSTSMDIG